MSQGNQVINNALFDLDLIIKNLNSVANKLEGLIDLQSSLNQGYSTASFLGQLDKLFSGLRQCLLSEQTNVEIVLKANQVLLDMITDIQHSDDLEIQYAQLIPIFIENLGSSKAVVRKSTHKCIATYVKLSKKLEFVLLHLGHTGLENTNTRTRQHSMLVIPALLSLKPTAVEKGHSELIELISKIMKRLKDPQEIVSKTAKKLILELQRCYPQHFERSIVNQLKTDDEKIICNAVLRQDEDEISRLLNVNVSNTNQQKQFQQQIEENKQPMSQQITIAQGNIKNLQNNKDLSIIGKAKDLEKIINEAKEESRYPKAQNGLYFGFLDDSLIELLNENNQWKERTNAIEAIESKLSMLLQNDKKMDFLPYSTQFLGFMLQYIPDINFKISLSSIKIIIKLLQLNIINFKKYYSQLVASLIEKLADSKVVIRQAVLKCCSLIITNYKASTFALQTLRYLQHGNWHVREGALFLIAHCFLAQKRSFSQQDQDIPLSLNPQIINDICSVIELEDKQKIQQLIIDVLALAIEKSPDKHKTQQLIELSFNIPRENINSDNDDLDFQQPSKEQAFYNSIQDRYKRGNFPFINEDGIVEFPLNNQNSLKSNISQNYVGNNDNINQVSQTIADTYKHTPSTKFLETKRKEEEKLSQMQQSNNNPHDQVQKNANLSRENDKISMWLPTFQGKEIDNVRTSQNLTSITSKDNFNITQSSVATTLDDGRSNITTTTMQSSCKKNVVFATPNNFANIQSQFSTFSDNTKTPEIDSVQSKRNLLSNNSNGKFGYTPESHQSKPRSIQSKEFKQRTVDNISQNYYDNREQDGFLESHFDINLPTQISLSKQFSQQNDQSHKNMNQSTGISGPFGMNSNQPVDRLTLLKTKYNSKNSMSADKRNHINNQVQNDNFSKQIETSQVSFQRQQVVPTQKSFGPIKAQVPAQQFMQAADNQEYNEISDVGMTPNLNKQKKPPLTQKSSSVQITRQQQRNQSLDASSNKNQQDVVEDNYKPIEEPLQNPELALKQAIDQIRSGDWSKQFEACNTIKRICNFHPTLLNSTNQNQLQLIKEIVKLSDSLRSQLAKNAILTLNNMYENLPSKDMDPSIDQVIPALLKKAADTNIFISEIADKTLASACCNCSEMKVFQCLQAQSGVRSNPLKVKLAMCYNFLIEKLGSKIRSFKEVEKLVQAVTSLLNEGAIEIRNMAKIGILQIKNSIGSQRELEGLIMRCISNEKQYEKIKQLLDKGDFEIAAIGNTRYGVGMRGSSQDSRSAGQFRNNGQPSQMGSGSDGFGKFQSSDFGSNSIYTNNSSGSQGFGTNTNAFKNTQQQVAKPVDPQLLEEFRQITNELQTNDWNKRLKAIDSMLEFVKNNQLIIKNAQASKFVQLMDVFCKLLQDNNAKVLAQAQQQFRIILLNQNLRKLVEQSLSLIIQALCSNLSSTNYQVKEQGDLLFTILEGAVDPNLLLQPIVAQLSQTNNKSKSQLVDKLANLLERCDKINLIQKSVNPIFQQSNKLQIEAQSNPKLREALQNLQIVYQRILCS